MRKREDYTGDYPDNWGSIAFTAKQRANWCCEQCRAEFAPSGKARHEQNRDGKPTILTVHHLDGNRANNEHANLLVVCQKCHLHIQGTWKPGEELPAGWWTVPEWIVERGLAYKPSSQLRMFPS